MSKSKTARPQPTQTEPSPEYGDVQPLYINGEYVGAAHAPSAEPTLADRIKLAFNNERQIDVCLELVDLVEHYAELCRYLHARVLTLEEHGYPAPPTQISVDFGTNHQPVVTDASTHTPPDPVEPVLIDPLAEPITLTGNEPPPEGAVTPVTPAE